MKKTLICAAAAAAMAGAASAETVAPTAIAFDDIGAIEASLTGQAGDPAAGREWFAGRKLGNCLACHVNADLAELGFHGEVGPPLDGVADRYSDAELRGIIANPKMMFGELTIMPSFYRAENGARPADKFAGKTILEAQQVEDIVAYLKTLTE